MLSGNQRCYSKTVDTESKINFTGDLIFNYENKSSALECVLADPNITHRRHPRRLGASEVHTPLLGFGAAPIGNLYRPLPNSVAEGAVAKALGLGLNYFDTAPHYGFGLSESRLGHALQGRVTDTILSTKVGRVLEPLKEGQSAALRHGFAEAPDLEPVFDYSYDGFMRSFESSLTRLGRERVDILWVHDLGRLTHGEDHQHHWQMFTQSGYRALTELRAEGRVKAIGLGANEWEICAQALDFADFDGFLLAGRYTLLEQGALESFLPLCARRGASVVLGGPFNSGILASGVAGEGPHYYNYEAAPAGVIGRVAQIEQVCADFNVPLAAAALQFPAAHPQVCSVLAGLADAAQVEQAVTLMNQSLPDEFWQVLKARELLDSAAPVPETTTEWS